MSKVDKATGEIVNATPKFVTKRLVNLPIISQRNVGDVFVIFLDVMKTSTQVAEGDGEKEPATIVPVIDMITGSVGQIIVTKVQHSLLDEHYPDGGYVLKAFKMTNLGKLNGKKYNAVNIEELEYSEADYNVKVYLKLIGL